jgi:large subunit ribosomal protein L25
MHKEVTLSVEVREGSGKIANRKLRRAGRIPAVIYGGEIPAVPVTISRDDMHKLLRERVHENTVFYLQVAGSDAPKPALVHDYQVDSLTHEIVHLDFLRIDMAKPVHLKVPVVLQGTAAGAKMGGLVEFLQREVEVTCLPADIPESIVVDITPLQIHQAIKGGQLPLPERVKLHSSPETIYVRVAAPKEEAAAAPAGAEAAPEAAEPEVIGKGKKEAEAEEAEE